MPLSEGEYRITRVYLIAEFVLQEELLFLMRKLVLHYRELPAQMAHALFNYLVRKMPVVAIVQCTRSLNYKCSLYTCFEK